MSCRFCVNKNLSACEKGDMEVSLYKKIIDEVTGKVHDVNLFHRGEPLLNKNIIPMIAYANKKGVKTRIHTNATLMDREIDRKMIMAGLDLISFSFDGFTKEEYEKNRTGAIFEKSLANIIDFLEVKKDLKSKKPYTIIQVIQDGEALFCKETPEHKGVKHKGVEQKSAEQEKAFLENFKGLPLDKIVVRKPHNWGGLLTIDKINNEITEAEKAEEEAEAKPEVETEVKAEVKKEAKAGIKTEIEAEIETKEGTGIKKYACCTFPWYSLTVFYDGRVFLCPQDFEGKIYLGDAGREKIEEIFNGVVIRDMRKRFGYGRIDKIDNIIPCRDCDRIRRKTFMGIPLEYLKIFLRDNLME